MKEKHPLTFRDKVSCTYHEMYDSVVNCLSRVDIFSTFFSIIL